MSQFDEFFDTLLENARPLAQDLLTDVADGAEQDAKAFINAAQTKLKTWTEQLATGALSPVEFESLVRSQRGLAAMFLVTQAGIAQAKIERFRIALINLIVDTAFAVFL